MLDLYYHTCFGVFFIQNLSVPKTCGLQFTHFGIIIYYLFKSLSLSQSLSVSVCLSLSLSLSVYEKQILTHVWHRNIFAFSNTRRSNQSKISLYYEQILTDTSTIAKEIKENIKALSRFVFFGQLLIKIKNYHLSWSIWPLWSFQVILILCACMAMIVSLELSQAGKATFYSFLSLKCVHCYSYASTI